MAEVDTLMLSQEHSDIRREATEHTNEIVKEGLKESFNIRGDVKDSRYDINTKLSDVNNQVSNQLDLVEDVMNSQFFAIGRESADNRAQLVALGYQVRDGFYAASKDAEINALKTQMEMAKQSTYLSDKIDGQAEKTRELVNELKNADLNRMLIERATEISEERHHGRHWRGQFDNAQFASLVNQINALNSNFQDTKQSMINFGYMSNAGQAATNNSVR